MTERETLTKEQIDEWRIYFKSDEEVLALCDMAERTEQAERESSERLKALLEAQERVRELQGQGNLESGSNELPAEHESPVGLSIEHIGMWRQWGRERFSVAHLHGYELLCDTALRGATASSVRQDVPITREPDEQTKHIAELEQRLAAAETALQAAREGMREECAQICDRHAYEHGQTSPTREIVRDRVNQCASAIRAIKP